MGHSSRVAEAGCYQVVARMYRPTEPRLQSGERLRAARSDCRPQYWENGRVDSSLQPMRDVQAGEPQTGEPQAGWPPPVRSKLSIGITQGFHQVGVTVTVVLLDETCWIGG